MSIIRLDHVNFITHNPEATITFYTEVIGLELGSHLTIDTSQSLYFYIPGSAIAILHVGNAKALKEQPKFKRLAELDVNQSGAFSTGAFDHFCLALDMKDYDLFIKKLESKKMPYQSYCHSDMDLKQIWLLDPNGVRVELNFIH
ncbi:VOC family protein [Legionella anisa]|uniref:VOC family protein n=1 Tax=Legionella anisa TaxID=28082 RepID=UPI00104128AE|nr:VOC family protein [Legionella anisa]